MTRVGNPVFASKSGRVTFAGEGKSFGGYVQIIHPDGASTTYAHLSEIRSCEGDWVQGGQTIGLSGKTGNASNAKILPHLHFEIHKNGRPVDPLQGLLDPKMVIR